MCVCNLQLTSIAVSCVAVKSIGALGSIPRVPPRHSLPAWEVKILAAQNIIFNQELFSQVLHPISLPHIFI